MGLKISKGRLRKPLRVVLYGVEGIGKTTLASQFPRPVFLDTEGSTVHFDVERVPNPRDEHDPVIRKWVDLLGVMHQLVHDRHGYETVVIDSADWAESLATTHLLESDKEKKRTSIEDYGYGKGYVMLAEIVSKCLAICDEMVRAGLNVVWVAHSKSVRVSPPDQTDGFDRYELKMHKQVGPLFKEWCDLLLFLNYRTIIAQFSLRASECRVIRQPPEPTRGRLWPPVPDAAKRLRSRYTGCIAGRRASRRSAPSQCRFPRPPPSPGRSRSSPG